MIKFKNVLLSCVGLYIFAALSLAYAENPGIEGASPKWHVGQRINEIYSQLNLTDVQKKQLEANKQQHRAKMEGVRREMKSIMEVSEQELMKPQLDMTRINVLHERIKVLQSQMEDDKFRSILAVRTILTPDQFSKFITLMHQHKQEHSK